MCHDCLIYDCLICAMAVLYVTFSGLDCLICDVFRGTQRGDDEVGHSDAESSASSALLLSSLELSVTTIYEPCIRALLGTQREDGEAGHSNAEYPDTDEQFTSYSGVALAQAAIAASASSRPPQSQAAHGAGRGGGVPATPPEMPGGDWVLPALPPTRVSHAC